MIPGPCQTQDARAASFTGNGDVEYTLPDGHNACEVVYSPGATQTAGRVDLYLVHRDPKDPTVRRRGLLQFLAFAGGLGESTILTACSPGATMALSMTAFAGAAGAAGFVTVRSWRLS